MATVQTAVHLRTGEPSAAEAIDAWLRRHGVGGTDFGDAYEICTYLVQQSSQVPDLAFVGTDWLAREEFAIVGYIRATWPGVGLVVYSSNGEAPPCESGPLVRVCRAPDALKRLLTDSPQLLLRRLREQAGEDLSRGPELSAENAAVRSSPSVSAGERMNAESRSTSMRPREQPSGLKIPPSSDQGPRSILTREELSALLDGKDAR